MSVQLAELIEQAMACLRKLHLSESTVDAYMHSAFKPLEKRIEASQFVDSELIKSQEPFFRQQFEDGIFSRNTLNKRLRGIRVLVEVYETGDFKWKFLGSEQSEGLPESFSSVLASFLKTQTCVKKRKDCIYSICRRFLFAVFETGETNVGNISVEHVQRFMIEISKSRSKSMDDVIYSLRAFFRYLSANGQYNDNFWMLLASPRNRDHRVLKCMSTEEISVLLENIDKTTQNGKRDFAAMSLAVVSGLRAGDIASLKLDDIDWKSNEIRIIQGKTGESLFLPIPVPVLQAVADYILNGRPDSDSRNVFIRHQAPFVEYHDGVSIASIFRKYQKKAGITHVVGDGKTMHGIRRGLGTKMTAEGIPVDVISQVLGHKGLKATKQYISADLSGMKKCILGFDSLGGDNNETS